MKLITKLVAVTHSTAGDAHTYLAAEALKQGAAELGYQIKVETQGSVGTKNQLTDADIAQADAVIVAVDTYVDISRFQGKLIYETSTKAAIRNAAEEIQTTLTIPAPAVGKYACPDWV